MKRADAVRATWLCTRQGFVAIRALARNGVLAAETVAVDVVPGFPAVAPYIADVAETCLAIRIARSDGADPLTALLDGWAAAGPVGRYWLAETVRDYAGRSAYQGLMTAVGKDPSSFPDRGADTSGRSRRVAWCNNILLAGFLDIRELAAPGGPLGEDDAALRRIEDIADTCHRLPCPDGLPAVLRPWLIRQELRGGWSSNSESGRRWCRERSEAGGLRPPAAIRRLIAPDRASG
ncbi:hypothetical protein CP967_26720 [Streptomyces nitrosporeus]|uniref:Uncharacterized protein n=1 Tax=Streptomyces nitrosporeus TaxID=28894 RepID=A0A5J6FF83_9ACTN|nr:hypothetical protein [Streptomyces nitrosporeus]QEU75098.1 hypothetical protein CP967_26720 [Streptomyces nitrosporeus]GGY90928.1 hypothetical protein GCM10010327_22040 [Streptomyces nitrosporeus]